MESKIIRVNLGSGVDFSDDFIGVDSYDHGQQHLLDITKDIFPFEDSSVDYMLANHVLEHLVDVQHTMNEAWRVLKGSGEFEINVPYGLWEGAWMPPHKQLITPSWFDFFRRGKTEIYGYKRWDIKVLEKRNNGAEIHCIMKPYGKK
jgi:ubiquinone/menaquinone biosynthesis C-methylase UbiE